MPPNDKPQEFEVDLLIAGAGPGGMAAGLTAALDGLDVLICEKSQQVGGTGSTSAGTLWIPGNSAGVQAGHADRIEDARSYLDALIGDVDADERREIFLRQGPDIIDDLTRRTDLSFVSCGHHPDYRNNLPGAGSSGRAIIPAPFDGRQLGKDFARVRPPINGYLLLGGMMVGKIDIERLLGRHRSLSNFLYSARLVLRYFGDRMRFSRGTRLVMGNALVAQLYSSLKKNGVPIHFGAAFNELMVEDGTVVGATLVTDTGTIQVRTRKGVVLATGGVAHNAILRAAFMPDPTPDRSMAVRENTGDGIDAAERAGARLDPGVHRRGGLWSPVSDVPSKDGSADLYPHILLDRAKPGLIAVNGAGRRFVNEGVSYHDFVEAMFRSNDTEPTMPAWLICDTAFVRKYGLGAIYPGTRRLRRFEKTGYIVTAHTITGLAGKLGIEGGALAQTVARHNRFAVSGIDEDFGKGDSELNQFNGDPDNKPNPCLAPIDAPPFVAMAVWPAEIACSSGLATNTHGQVLDTEDRPIDGLYACGNDMASIMGGHYPGPGTTLGPALVFGYRVAKHAAGHRDGL
jgi:succinate dehydrogenase/fumarate reductase flavoprotein subunit